MLLDLPALAQQSLSDTHFEAAVLQRLQPVVGFAEASHCRRALLSAHRALRPGGALACNLIGTLAEEGPVSDFVSCASGVFDTVRVVPVLDLHGDLGRDRLRNVVVVAA